MGKNSAKTGAGPRHKLLNYVNGAWAEPGGPEGPIEVRNPASGEVLASYRGTAPEAVAAAAEAARKAAASWRQVPPVERARALYALRERLESSLEELARTITLECGKTLEEARGEIRRGIENVEVACGIPALLQGHASSAVARGIDEWMVREPVGVVAAITPFNFPGMIPLWFLPYAVACGNAFILKPSDRVPLTSQRIFQIIDGLGLPKGLVQLVNGGKGAVDALLDHPAVGALSFVGSTTVARYVYSRATANGKRAQCQGGARNPAIVLPDADPGEASEILAESAFGCAGQRCLAASVAITVGKARKPFVEAVVAAARRRKVGSGLDKGVETGPVISSSSLERIEGLIGAGVRAGARAVEDGRGTKIRGYESGYFIRPTVLDGVPEKGKLAETEIFGPVLSLMHADTVEDAIRLVNRGSYGNMACLFTRDGGAAARFRHEVRAGNIGINIGVAAPVAYFPFCGMRRSFFGDLHAQGRDAIDFYTEKKVVIERWPS